MKRRLLKYLAIKLVNYLHNKFIELNDKYKYKQSNQNISKIILIQDILYYLETQFSSWGYFHPECSWTIEDEIEFRKLFPTKKFPEIDEVTYHNHHAITFYHNQIKNDNIRQEIEKDLRKWQSWI